MSLRAARFAGVILEEVISRQVWPLSSLSHRSLQKEPASAYPPKAINPLWIVPKLKKERTLKPAAVVTSVHVLQSSLEYVRL